MQSIATTYYTYIGGMNLWNCKNDEIPKKKKIAIFPANE
jgi:hypothetical protein